MRPCVELGWRGPHCPFSLNVCHWISTTARDGHLAKRKSKKPTNRNSEITDSIHLIQNLAESECPAMRAPTRWTKVAKWILQLICKSISLRRRRAHTHTRKHPHRAHIHTHNTHRDRDTHSEKEVAIKAKKEKKYNGRGKIDFPFKQIAVSLSFSKRLCCNSFAFFFPVQSTPRERREPVQRERD